MNIHDFDDIRPYMAEELPGVIDKLLADPEFQYALSVVYAGQPFEAIAGLMRSSVSNEDFQVKMIYPFLTQLLSKQSDGIHYDFSQIPDKDKSYTFISNHRDIVLDSALLDYGLVDDKRHTVEIAIGDNLLIRPWIKDLVRVNKSFIVQRSLNMREMLMASAKMSRYMHFAINEKHESIWIAQREGRAKDGNDETQESVLKMMAMGGDLEELNIVPLSIVYEFDPCDYLKAQELQQRRDNPDFKKSPQDDLDNMREGIYGFKGEIWYTANRCLNASWLNKVKDLQLPKQTYFNVVAKLIDHEIHSGYHTMPTHYVALDRYLNERSHSDLYDSTTERRFDEYIEHQLSKVSIANPDWDFLRHTMLKMYATPIQNHLKACASSADILDRLTVLTK